MKSIIIFYSFLLPFFSLLDYENYQNREIIVEFLSCSNKSSEILLLIHLCPDNFPEAKRRLRSAYYQSIKRKNIIDVASPIDMMFENYKFFIDREQIFCKNDEIKKLIFQYFCIEENFRKTIQEILNNAPGHECFNLNYCELRYVRYFIASDYVASILIHLCSTKRQQEEINNFILNSQYRWYQYLLKTEKNGCRIHILPDACFWHYNPIIRSSLIFLDLNGGLPTWSVLLSNNDYHSTTNNTGPRSEP